MGIRNRLAHRLIVQMISDPKQSPIETVDETWSTDGVLFVDHTLNRYCLWDGPNPGFQIAAVFARQYTRLAAGFRCVVLCLDGEKAHKPAVREQRNARVMSATTEFIHNNAAAIDEKMFDALAESGKDVLFCLAVGSNRGNPGHVLKASDPHHPLVRHIRESLESSVTIVEADHLMFHTARHLADLGKRCVISSKDSDIFGSLLALAHSNISARYQTKRYDRETSLVELSVDMVQSKVARPVHFRCSYSSPWKMLLDYTACDPTLDGLLESTEQIMETQKLDIYQFIKLCVRRGVRGVLARKLTINMTYMTQAAVSELLISLAWQSSADRAVAKLFARCSSGAVTRLMEMYRLRVPTEHFYQRCLAFAGKTHVDVTCAPGSPNRDLWLFTALVSGTDYTRNIPRVGEATLLKCLAQPMWKRLAVRFAKLDAVTTQEGIDLYNAIRDVTDLRHGKSAKTLSDVCKASMVKNMLYVRRLWALEKPLITSDQYGYVLDNMGNVQCTDDRSGL